MTQSNFQGKAQPPQPSGFKIQPPGSHCQLALSLGFDIVLALTSCLSKFGPPHWLGHGLRPCLSANLAGKLLRNPGRFLAKKCSGKPKLGWPGINASARHSDWCPGRTGPQLRLPGHDLTAFDKTGLPAKTKFNSFRVALLYPPHPPSFSQPTTIGPPAGSPKQGLPHSTILVATKPRKAERLIFNRCTPKLPLQF